MNDFKGRHFEGEIVLWAVRWYCQRNRFAALVLRVAERYCQVKENLLVLW